MFICYLDESGVPQQAAGTPTYVLCGLAIPVAYWKRYDERLSTLKAKHKLGLGEVHTAWMARYYPEQQRITDFADLTIANRRRRVRQERKVDLAKTALRGQKARTPDMYRY